MSWHREQHTDLESMPGGGIDGGARQAFLALALNDERRYSDSLRMALTALIPTLDGYKQALTKGAAELRAPSRHIESGCRVEGSPRNTTGETMRVAEPNLCLAVRLLHAPFYRGTKLSLSWGGW